MWELTEEIIVLGEEKELEREKERDRILAEQDDIVPGEEKDNEAELAPKKSIMSVKSVFFIAVFFTKIFLAFFKKKKCCLSFCF